MLKIHGKDLTGITPRKAKTAGDGKDAEPKASTAEDTGSGQSDTYVSPTQQQLFKTLISEYYKSLEAHLVRDHKVRLLETCDYHYVCEELENIG